MSPERLWRWAPLLTALSLLGAPLWYALRQREDASIRRWSEIEARRSASRIEERTLLFERAILRMARRLDVRPDLEVWRADASRYRAGFPALTGLAWLDRRHRVLAAEPPEVASVCRPPPERVSALAEALDAVAARGTLHWAKAELEDGQRALCAYAPLEGGDYLAGAVLPGTTLATFLPDEDDGEDLEVRWDGEPLYARGDVGGRSFAEFAASHPVRVGDQTFEIRFGPASGQVQELRSAATGLLLVGGQALALALGLALFATRRARQRSRELDAANRQLADEIARRRRTESLLEREAERLRETGEELARSNQEMKDFAHIVSHDLRAPLRGIHSLAGWLAEDQRERVDDKGREYLDLMRQRVRQLGQLLDGVLQISRVGRDESSPEPFSLELLVREVVSLLELDEKAEVQVQGDLPEVTARRAQLTHVFQNLFENAVRYCDKPTARVEVSCRDRDDAWEVRVTDNGPGIDPDQHERAFQMFRRLDPDGEVDGTGIGLAVVRKVIERHGGRVGIESQPGAGASFWFTLPKPGGNPAS